MNIDLIKAVCKEIIGLNIYKVSRTCDMLCLEIGEEISYKSSCKVGKYAFHIQCPWRISNEEILLGSRDIYSRI